MDILYYNNQVKEELDGAMEYIKKAILLKKDHEGHSITSVICLKCGNKMNPAYLNFKTIPLEEEGVVL